MESQTATETVISTETTVHEPMPETVNTTNIDPATMNSSATLTQVESVGHVQLSTRGALLENENPWMRVFGSLASGELPPNKVLFETLDTTSAHLAETRDQAHLNAQGQRLVEDAREIIASAKRLLEQRNAEERIQKFVHHSKAVTMKAAEGVKQESGDASGVRSDATVVLSDVRVVALFVVRSREFRNVLLQLVEIFQALVSNTTQKFDVAANRSMPQNLSTRNFLASASTSTGSVPTVSSGGTSLPYNATADTLKDVASQLRTDARSGSLLDETRKQELLTRLRLLVAQLGRTPEYSDAVTRIFNLVDFVRAKKETGSGRIKDPVVEQHFDQMWEEGKAVLQQFVGPEAPDLWAKNFMEVIRMTSQDPQMREYFTRLRAYFVDVMRDPNSVNTDATINEGTLLVDQGKTLFNQPQYRMSFKGLFDITKLILQRFRDDPTTRDVTNAVARFSHDFALDENDQPDLIKLLESLNQLKMVSIPFLVKEFSNVRLPTITSSDEKMDISIGNLVLQPEDLLPEFIDLDAKNKWRMNTRQLNSSKTITKVTLKMKDIRPVFKDVHFSYKKKTFPKVADQGRCDVDLSRGTGVALKATWIVESEATQPTSVNLRSVNCSVGKTKLTILEAKKHKTLDKVATSMFAGRIRRSVAKAVEKNFREKSATLTAQINRFFERRPLASLTTKANASMKAAYQNKADRKAERRAARQPSYTFSEGSYVQDALLAPAVITPSGSINVTEVTSHVAGASVMPVMETKSEVISSQPITNIIAA